MPQTYKATQKVYQDFVSSVHKRVYGLTANGKMLLTTNHSFYKNAVISEKLKQAEFIKENGKDSEYSISTFEGLHVASLREGYSSIQQQAKCAMLYKQGKEGQFDKPEHSTVILTQNAEDQVEYIGNMVNSHCLNYNIDLRRGYSYSEVPYISVSGAYKDEEIPEMNMHCRSDLMGLEVRLTQGPMFDFIQGIEEAPEQ